MRPETHGRTAALQEPLSTDGARSVESARASLYARVMGVPGGSADQTASNREFEGLWLRFVSAVALFARQPHLAGFAAGAAQGLADEARARLAQGPRHAWDVAGAVAAPEPGGGAGTARERALALAGGEILERLGALGAHAGGLAHSENSLLDACEMWLAVTGVRDDEVERLSQPGEARAQVDAWSRALTDAVGWPESRASGFANRPGPTAVFAGPSGSDKTLAAHWLASAAGKDVHRIDLHQVVSRYIGETEKNLDRVFADARDAGAVLLFDEADALLGKRTDVKDAHDRYADVDVGGLAQRLEAFDGLAVIATSQSANTIDPRLLHRVDARVVSFPLPGR